jgi:hypothetical protein
MKDRSYCLAGILRRRIRWKMKRRKGKRHHTSEESEDEASNDESVKVESVVFAASNSPDQPEKMMPANKFKFLIRSSLLKKRTKLI